MYLSDMNLTQHAPLAHRDLPRKSCRDWGDGVRHANRAAHSQRHEPLDCLGLVVSVKRRGNTAPILGNISSSNYKTHFAACSGFKNKYITTITTPLNGFKYSNCHDWLCESQKKSICCKIQTKLLTGVESKAALQTKECETRTLTCRHWNPSGP